MPKHRAKPPVGALTTVDRPEDAQPRGARDGRLGRTHDRAIEALGEIAAGTPADRALGGVFRRGRDLGAAERTEVSELVYGFIRAQRAVDDKLDHALKAEGKKKEVLDAPILLRMRVLAYLASKGATLADLGGRDDYAFRRVGGVFERIVADRLPPAKQTELEALAIGLSLPDWMASRMVAAFGVDRTVELGRALDGRAPVTLRVNAALSTRDAVRARIAAEQGVDAAPTALSPLGLILPGPVDLQAWAVYQEGLVELQDEGSQLVALATGAAPREVVLDGCAGAGGKTLALGAMMRGTGRLVALDPDAKKLEALKKRVRRAGLTSVEALAGDLEGLPAKLRGSFDRVLVDAPCSGSGTFRRHPDAKWRLTERELERHVARQRRLLAAGASALKPGGVLVYATCSFLHEEDEAVVHAALAEDPRLDPLPLAELWGAPLARQTSATWSARVGPGPTEKDPDGFFVAAMRKTAPG